MGLKLGEGPLVLELQESLIKLQSYFLMCEAHSMLVIIPVMRILQEMGVSGDQRLTSYIKFI